jgi:2-keto-4-pentenoate hydratase/2-oxohepta-3-ene-1,7-dioic acid hydratase in catechol pathway
MKIICIGRNYVEHIQELNNTIPTAPVVFMKPSTALLKNNAAFYFPDFTKDIHYECEIVYRICKNGKYIQQQFASNYYDAYTLGIDFTARDLQEVQKAKGLPWEIAKAFDNSAVIGDWIPLPATLKKQPILFDFLIDNTVAQHGDSTKMMFNIDAIIVYVSQFFSLQQGDIIFTGTPAGVGSIAIGQQLQGFVNKENILSCTIK